MNILIVDDSATMRKVIKNTLEKMGCNSSIEEASNGKEAFERIQQNKNIDCLFLDINMPVMSGLELIEELKVQSLRNDIDIILFSTEISTMTKEEIDKLEVIGTIAKPFKQSELTKTLIPLLEKVKDRVEIKDKKEVKEEVKEEVKDGNKNSKISDDIEKENITQTKEIELKKSIDECIEEYVSSYTKAIDDNAEDLKKKKQLDYQRMKRFMMTAYNNLMDIDPTLRISNLEESKNSLLNVEKIYEAFSKRMGFPMEVAYEEIFLHLQEDYMYFYNIVEDLKIAIEVSTKKAKSLNAKLKSQKELLKKIKKDTLEYTQILNEFKSENKKYADLMHNLSTSKDELKSLNIILKNFKDRYYEDFIGKFENIYVDYDKKLLNVLNAKCHELDTIMWEKAKVSKPLKKFFEESRIKGGFSTLTFLEYYLKSVDTTKELSEENTKLFELLDYLKIINNKTITIIHSDMNEMITMKNNIEKITTGYKVNGYTSPEKLLDKSLKKQDLIILDYEMRTLNIKDFFKKYKKTHRNSKAKFLLLFSSLKKATLMEAMELGLLNMKIKNYLVKAEHLSQLKLQDKVNNLI